jgi:hypothetical protein
MTPRAAKPTRATIPNQRLLDRCAERRWPAVVNALSTAKTTRGQGSRARPERAGRPPRASVIERRSAA